MHIHRGQDVVDAPDVTYDKRLVAFIDVLGFKKLIEGQTTADAQATILALEQNVLSHLAPEPRDAWSEEHDVRAKIFSDCICMSAKDSADGLVWLFVRSIIFQCLLIQRGYLCRGAITLGRHYCSEKLIYSEALVKAFLLEHFEAWHPRIIVDAPVVELAMQMRPGDVPAYAPGAPRFPEPKQMLVRDADGRRFLDYGAFRVLPEASGFARRHRELIDRGAREFRGRDLSLKYEWMATFHNTHVGPEIAVNMAELFPSRAMWLPRCRQYLKRALTTLLSRRERRFAIDN